MLELYTIDGCSRCHRVKLRLDELAIPFVEKNLFEEQRFAEELINLNRELVTPALVNETRVFTGDELWDELELLTK
ncbi:hypothetical protein EVJ27_13085 [Exiguobacterium sp. SH3S2]|uniref:glutaredoxin domain-containing protein n=1 Tax=Exiguobacterium TaxID=33986 RepID=UPI0008775717|nr:MULTISPECIES: glutaredoxin domain-containing protein [Exiguobacterium]TCI24108.1 hypothetical protein EVJ32_15365 [Exiguobacterium sp. SH5S4]TCI41988.1 hypothetical protein EVJ28_13180 [Exiguobacterium sp. SH3S3]TCI48322.1 hypothetical protein EVJ31_04610 [Exiguobacterium sp. SH5S32]TCI52106.1 hypothetical protein EVJ30_10060 [Exiguobacterium sp. SH5S13]TCI55209.1 hypothetical protein EVJ25_04600 [Exiguobacterium sp. SH1S4]